MPYIVVDMNPTTMNAAYSVPPEHRWGSHVPRRQFSSATDGWYRFHTVTCSGGKLA